MPKSATLSGERRRTEILDAALRCFDHQGITATTIEDIRAESGASIGSIYHQLARRTRSSPTSTAKRFPNIGLV